MIRLLRLIIRNWPLKLGAIVLSTLLYSGLVLSQTTRDFPGSIPILASAGIWKASCRIPPANNAQARTTIGGSKYGANRNIQLETSGKRSTGEQRAASYGASLHGNSKARTVMTYSSIITGSKTGL